MREVHRFIADSIYKSDRFDAMVERIVARNWRPRGGRWGLWAPGPTGLAAAFYLALLGHDVTVYDPNPEPGGMLRYAIPDYRLPKDIVRREIELIRRMGVNFVGGVSVGTDITLTDLDNQFNAVFLAIGTWKEAWVYLPGTELKGVMPALTFLEGVSKEGPAQLGRQVVVNRRRKRGHRFGADGVAHGRRSDGDLPPRKEGYAGHPRRNGFGGGRRREVPVPGDAPPDRGDEAGNVKAIEVVKTKAGRVRLLGPPPPRADRRNPPGCSATR